MIHPDLDELATIAAAADWPGRHANRVERVEWLYDWYLRREPLPRRSGPPQAAEVAPAAALRAAHAGVTRFSGGWQTTSATPSGRAIAARQGEVRHLTPGEYVVPGRPGSPARAGDPLLVSDCWDWVSDDEFFWYTRDGAWPPTGADRLVRTYWNCAPADAPTLVAAITAVVHGATDYHLKTALPAAHGGRADGAVLYLGPSAFTELRPELITVADDLHDVLREVTPRLTAPLAGGLGWAEGALDGDSFGQRRAEVLADALTDAPSDAGAIAVAIETAFVAAGLDPERPHLDGRAAS